MRPAFARLSFATALLVAAFLTSDVRTRAAGSLFDAIRRNDIAAARSLVADGASVTAPDEAGATPLMHAALYAGPDMLALLLDRGAQINAVNAYGATALMWAVTHTPNVKLLIERGADLNARASDGITPLAAAARLNNPDALRILLAAGADTSGEARAVLLTGAYLAPSPRSRDILKSFGIVMRSAADFKPATVLARNSRDLPTLTALLEAGVDPKEQVPFITFSLPTFFVAAREGNLNAMKALVKAGVNPIDPAGRGWTALMLTAGDDQPSEPVMQYLLDAGVDVNAKDDDGRTALDWALTRGETATSRFLRAAGGRTAASPQPAPAPVATPRSAAAAVERAIARLQPAGPAFNDRTKCSSCHNQNLPGMAVTLARRHGIAIDESLVNHSLTAANQVWRRRREAVLLGDASGGFMGNAFYTLFQMAEEGAPPTAISDALVVGIAARQGESGSWPGGADIRPPLANAPISSAAFAIRALRNYAPEGRRTEMDTRVSRAVAFLRGAQPQDTQEVAFKLLGLMWGGAAADEVTAARQALADLQRPDGGWGQLPSMDPDAYATGQALYALHAARMPASDPIYQEGADWLRRTQLDDGTWFVRTRAFGFQPYFETGFPHGRSQFISTAATAWASIALTYTLESPNPPSSGR